MQQVLILRTIWYMHYSYWKYTFHTVDHGNNFINNRVQSKWPSKGDMHILTMYIHVHTYYMYMRGTHIYVRLGTRLTHIQVLPFVRTQDCVPQQAHLTAALRGQIAAVISPRLSPLPSVQGPRSAELAVPAAGPSTVCSLPASAEQLVGTMAYNILSTCRMACIYSTHTHTHTRKCTPGWFYGELTFGCKLQNGVSV